MTTERFVPRPVEPIRVPVPVQRVPERVDPEDEGEDLSDLVEVPPVGDFSNLADVEDLVEVTPEDVIGGGDADMSDDVLSADVGLTPQDEEDLFGIGEPTPETPARAISRRIKRPVRRFVPPPSVGGINV